MATAASWLVDGCRTAFVVGVASAGELKLGRAARAPGSGAGEDDELEITSPITGVVLEV